MAVTYEDLVHLPDTVIAEILGGELHATPRPAPVHTRAYSSLGTTLRGSVRPTGSAAPAAGGILGEPELHLGGDVLVPDLAGWRRSRMPRLPETAYFPLVPDWVCEILSPSTAVTDRVTKLAIYAREHVAHAWLIDPTLRTLEVLRLENNRWTIVGSHAGSEVVRAEPFAELDLALHLLWSDPPEA